MATTSAASSSSTGFTSALGEQQFLQLMVAQLQNQNPLEPVDQQDYLAQLAQFSSLSGIEQLNSNFADLFKLQSITQGAGLIGKEVSYNSTITGQTDSGVITQANLVSGKVQLTVNNEQVPMDNILSVMGSSVPTN